MFYRMSHSYMRRLDIRASALCKGVSLFLNMLGTKSLKNYKIYANALTPVSWQHLLRRYNGHRIFLVLYQLEDYFSIRNN